MRLLLFVFISMPFLAFPQSNIQTLENQLKSSTGTEKITILNQLSEALLHANPTKSVDYGKQALDLARQIQDVNNEAKAIVNLGKGYSALNKHQKAIKYFTEGVTFYEKYKNESGIAFNLNAIGLEHKSLRNYQKAAEACGKAVKIYEKMNDKQGSAYVHANIGDIYYKWGKYKQSASAYEKSHQMHRQMNDQQGMASALSRVGTAYSALGNYEKALEYLKKAESIASSAGLNNMLSIIGKNIATIEANMANKAQSKTKYDIEQEQKTQEYIHTMEGVTAKSLEEIEKLSEEAQLKELKIKSIQDEYEKQLLTKEKENAEQEKELAIKNAALEKEKAEKERKDAELKQKNMQVIGLIGGSALLLLLLLAIFSAYRNKQKANVQLSTQKQQIEKQNNQIISSINYAERIQHTILPSGEEIKKHFSDSFILFKPKDIVSGDFYWMHEQNGQVLFTAVDCTGHGVPGAFMSIIGYNMLEKVVKELKITKPSEILDALSKHVSERLKQGEKAEVKDGMDMALFSFDKQKMQLQFAGAHNPLYLIRNGELTEYKGDRKSIGYGHHYSQLFTNQELRIEKGDCIYIFSDGFVDQRGGVKNKKFYYPPFRKLLIDIHQLPFNEQQKRLEKTIKMWKGNIPQVDDMLIVGLRV